APPSIPINEAKLRSLRKRLSQLNPRQYQVFKLLVEHDTPMSVEQIAAWLSVTRPTAQKYLPPHALYKLGLVKRTQEGSAYIYEATIKKYLEKEFPGADIRALLAQVLT